MSNHSEKTSPGGSFSLALSFAGRYVLTRPKSSMSAFISRVSMTGLAIAVALLIMVLSVMNGFERDMRERILGLLPQISLYSYYPETDWGSVSDIVSKHTDVLASAPFLNLQGLLVKGRRTEAALLIGIDPDKEGEVSIINQYVPEAILHQLKGNDAILGEGLANHLKVKKGSSVVFLMPQNEAENETPQLAKFKILDILVSGTEIDRHAFLVNIETAKQLNQVESQALRISTNDLFAVDRISDEILMSLPNHFIASNWTKTHGNLYAAINLSKRLLLFLIFIVITVAIFNIISSLVLLVNNKRGDIAILQTMGMTPKYIMLTFLLQGSFIAIIGTLIGLVLGVLFTFSINHVVQFVEHVFAFKILNPDVYPLNYLPVDMRLKDTLFVCGVSILIGVIATIYPSWRAAHVLPAKALSNSKA